MNINLQKRIYDVTGTLIREATCGGGHLECYTNDRRWIRFKPFPFDPNKFNVEVHDAHNSYCECVIPLSESELCKFIKDNEIPRHALIGQRIAIGGKYWKDEKPSFWTKFRRVFYVNKDEHWRPGDEATIQYRGMSFHAKCLYVSEGYDDLLCGSSAAGSDWLILN